MSQQRDGSLTAEKINQILDRELLPIHSIDPIIRTFILSYCTMRHVGDAAKAAGISRAQGNTLLNRADISEAIKAIGTESARKYGFDASEVIARVNDIVQVDIADLLNEDGTVKSIHEIPSDIRRSIKSFKVEEKWEKDLNGMDVKSGRIIDVTFWDKLKGAELLGRQEGLFKQTVVHEHEVGRKAGEILLSAVDAAQARVREVVGATAEPIMIEGKKV